MSMLSVLKSLIYHVMDTNQDRCGPKETGPASHAGSTVLTHLLFFLPYCDIIDCTDLR